MKVSDLSNQKAHSRCICDHCGKSLSHRADLQLTDWLPQSIRMAGSTSEDDKTGKVEKCGWIPGELKSVRD